MHIGSIASAAVMEVDSSILGLNISVQKMTILPDYCSSTSDFVGKVGLNLASRLVTSRCKGP